MSHAPWDLGSYLFPPLHVSHCSLCSCTSWQAKALREEHHQCCLRALLLATAWLRYSDKLSGAGENWGPAIWWNVRMLQPGPSGKATVIGKPQRGKCFLTNFKFLLFDMFHFQLPPFSPFNPFSSDWDFLGFQAAVPCNEIPSRDNFCIRQGVVDGRSMISTNFVKLQGLTTWTESKIPKLSKARLLWHTSDHVLRSKSSSYRDLDPRRFCCQSSPIRCNPSTTRSCRDFSSWFRLMYLWPWKI